MPIEYVSGAHTRWTGTTYLEQNPIFQLLWTWQLFGLDFLDRPLHLVQPSGHQLIRKDLFQNVHQLELLFRSTVHFGGDDDRVRRGHESVRSDGDTDGSDRDRSCQRLAMIHDWFIVAIIYIHLCAHFGQIKYRSVRVTRQYLLSTLRQPASKALTYPSTVLSPFHW